MFFKIYVLQNCVISTGKNLCMVAEMLQKTFLYSIFFNLKYYIYSI